MLPSEIRQILLSIDQVLEQKYVRVATIRHLAGTEENYQTIMREVDRVRAQLSYARADHAPATLTMSEWFGILDRFAWKCAYCGKKTFQVICHQRPRHERGTTAENCVPACYSCLSKPWARQILLPYKS